MECETKVRQQSKCLNIGHFESCQNNFFPKNRCKLTLRLIFGRQKIIRQIKPFFGSMLLNGYTKLNKNHIQFVVIKIMWTSSANTNNNYST